MWLASFFTFLLVIHAVAAAPTLEELRARIATDRLAGLAEGWAALEAGWFDDQPDARRSLLWFMGGAALGGADDAALERVVDLLNELAADDPVAGSLAGFLRGSRLLSLGQQGEGLVEMLQAANAVIGIDDPAIQRIASGELCRGYTQARRLEQALTHCQRQTSLAGETDDPPALAAAEHAEAIVLSYQGEHRQAAELWRSARRRFHDAGMPELSSRLSGSLAAALLELSEYDQALEMAKEAHEQALAGGSPTSIAMTGEYVGSALLGLRRYEESVAVLERALASLEGISYPGIERSVLRALKVAQTAIHGEYDPRVAELGARLDALMTTHPPAPELVETIDQLEAIVRERTLDLRIRQLEREAELRTLALETATREAAQREAVVRNQRRAMAYAGVAVGALIAATLALVLLLRSQRRLASSLHAQAYQDALTGLPNRRAFTERAAELIDDSGPGARTHSLMIIDLDHFKRVNDQGGHPLGDDVLVSTAHCLRELVPGLAMVARLGGEEFAVLCPDSGLSQARALAEQLCRAVAGQHFELGGQPLRVTASIGVASLSTDDHRSLSDWMKQADQALYAAKSAGRNRVESQPD